MLIASQVIEMTALARGNTLDRHGILRWRAMGENGGQEEGSGPASGGDGNGGI